MHPLLSARRRCSCSRLSAEVRFLEFMPFDGNAWSANRLVPQAEIVEAGLACSAPGRTQEWMLKIVSFRVLSQIRG